jgi:membrane protein implicated in regulation of membrane protease activity
LDFLLTPWVLWALLALALLIAEAFISGFFIFWFGVGAVPAAMVAGLLPGNIVLQLAVFAASSILAMIAGRPFAKRLYKGGSDEKFGAARLVGVCCMVTETIDPDKGKGMVRAEHDEWRAETADGSVVANGNKVRVLRISGTRLIVEPIAAAQAEHCEEED